MRGDRGRYLTLKRRSTRVEGFDYATPGYYFFTACERAFECHWGTVVDGRVRLSAEGACIRDAWHALPSRFGCVGLDAFVVMPNHVHGILRIRGADEGAAGRRASLSQIVGAFKSTAALRIRSVRGRATGPIWQRGFHERIVRSDEELEAIRGYIDGNPSAWNVDRYRPRPGRNVAPS